MELWPPTSPLHRSTARGHPRAGSTPELETPLPLETSRVPTALNDTGPAWVGALR